MNCEIRSLLRHWRNGTPISDAVISREKIKFPRHPPPHPQPYGTHFSKLFINILRSHHEVHVQSHRNLLVSSLMSIR